MTDDLGTGGNTPYFTSLRSSRDGILEDVAAAIIFFATYLVLALGRMPGLRIDRTGAAIIGASLMVGTNVLTLDEAYRAGGLYTMPVRNVMGGQRKRLMLAIGIGLITGAILLGRRRKH